MTDLHTAMHVLTAVDHIEAGLLILDSHINIRYCNQFILKHSAVKLEHWLDRPLLEVFPESNTPKWLAMLEQVRETGEPIQTTWRDGPYLIHLQATPRNDATVTPAPMQQSILLYCFMDESETPYFGLVIFDNSKVANATKQLHLALANVQQKHQAMEALHQQLKQANSQLLQSEKMAAVGQLAAGVAHEINNPVGFVASNLKTLADYVRQLLSLVDEMSEWGGLELEKLKKKYDYEFIRDDISGLLSDSHDGVERVKKIISSLRDFSHTGEEHFAPADLIQGIESTLNLVNNEIKYKAEVIKQLEPLPPVECIAAQINQVVMNLLINAAQAITSNGIITLRTGSSTTEAWIEVEDTGSGMSESVIARIFEPFFTTKAVGKGTGLGLALSFNIIQKHHGRIAVRSTVGQGTCFTITLPICQPASLPHTAGERP
jgi:two-component system, NtrC family, sensor kinase